MVQATMTTCEGDIVRRTFQSMNEMTDYLQENHGKFNFIVAKVIEAKEARQGRCDRKDKRP